MNATRTGFSDDSASENRASPHLHGARGTFAGDYRRRPDREAYSRERKSIEHLSGAPGLSAASAVWQKNTATTEFSSNPTNPESVRLVLKPVKELREPDLLLYWTAEAGSSDLSQARLLGAFAEGRVYSLTGEEYRGDLILYSLAHRAIVDQAKVEGLR